MLQAGWGLSLLHKARLGDHGDGSYDDYGLSDYVLDLTPNLHDDVCDHDGQLTYVIMMES